MAGVQDERILLFSLNSWALPSVWEQPKASHTLGNICCFLCKIDCWLLLPSCPLTLCWWCFCLWCVFNRLNLWSIPQLERVFSLMHIGGPGVRLQPVKRDLQWRYILLLCFWGCHNFESFQLSKSHFCSHIAIAFFLSSIFLKWFFLCSDFQFKLQVEPSQDTGDDTALNSICLVCSNGEEICSKKGFWGAWGESEECSRGFIAADYKLELQSTGDNTAGNDFKLYCKPDETEFKVSEIPIPGWGNWVGKKSCSQQSVICGIQTRVQEDQFDGDDSTLNGVKLFCCLPQEHTNQNQNLDQNQNYYVGNPVENSQPILGCSCLHLLIVSLPLLLVKLLGSD